MLLQNPLNIRTVDVVQVVFLIIQTAALILAYYFIFFMLYSYVTFRSSLSHMSG